MVWTIYIVPDLVMKGPLVTQWYISDFDYHCFKQWLVACSVSQAISKYRGYSVMVTLIARFMGPTWGPSGTDRTQVGPMLAPWTLLSGNIWDPKLAITMPADVQKLIFIKELIFRSFIVLKKERTPMPFFKMADEISQDTVAPSELKHATRHYQMPPSKQSCMPWRSSVCLKHCWKSSQVASYFIWWDLTLLCCVKDLLMGWCKKDVTPVR